ncbi:MAG TPA: NfeD family protein [Acetobacteraceae bacterium]|nr:NfeD family protein [Acetobacteraceae bacterium]
MIPWWGWAVAAAVIAWAELHAPGSYLIWIAVGAAATAALQAVWDLSLERQIIAFVVCSCIACFGGYFVYKRTRDRPDSDAVLNQRDRAMLGARAVVSTSIVNGEGKVRIGDTVWLAEGPDLAEGTPVVVSAVHGSRLVVRRDGA